MSINADEVDDQHLSALVLRLTVSPDRVIDVAGATAQALVLGLVKRQDPELAANLRSHPAARPYTIAVLREERVPTQIAIRITSVGTAIPRVLAAAVEQAHLQPPVRIGPLNVSGMAITTSPGQTPWANAASLGSVQRGAEALGDTLTCILASPLLPRHRPVAWRDGPPTNATLTPALLFEAMSERWRALGRMMPGVCGEAVRGAALQAEVAESQITVATHLQHGGRPSERTLLRGFLGWITLRLHGSPAERALLRMLAAASFYLGAGIGTASGMGCLRALPGSKQPSRGIPANGKPEPVR